MDIQQTSTGGTHVDCVVDLYPFYKGVPIVPHLAIRHFVQRKFTEERRRDLAHAQAAAGTFATT